MYVFKYEDRESGGRYYTRTKIYRLFMLHSGAYELHENNKRYSVTGTVSGDQKKY